VIFAGIGVFLSASILYYFRRIILVELFERIGWFFAHLETYTEVAPTTAMTNIITEIMVEVLKIFSIATKELKRGSASEFQISCVWTFTNSCTEQFLRNLVGMANQEDALKKLDRLTQEEARCPGYA
jgi:hypothetical protein